MTNAKFDALMGGPPRKPEEWLTQRDMDIAASIQSVTEEVVTRLVDSVVTTFGTRDLCLAGGVALNCVANGKVLRSGKVDRLWIQPAAGDAGGALGAALAAYHLCLDKPRPRHNGLDGMSGSLLGPEFDQQEIEGRLRAAGARYHVRDDGAVIDETAQALVEQKAIGWFQGRMEFGPRALGSRSILADPRAPEMQKRLNLKIKYRESFRPFAPSVRHEDVAEWFELGQPSPYMLLVADVAQMHRVAMTDEQKALFGIDKLNVPRSNIPAVTHVDYSARVQTVHRETNPRFHQLLSTFHAMTGCPVLVNTSFNVRGEPIVCTPEDAFRCFMGTELDVLAIGNCILRKEEQPPSLRLDYSNAFAPD
jgi:carbamoyltransferase